MRLNAISLLPLAWALGACGGQAPPMTHTVGSVPRHTDGTAKLVFLWAPDSCEVGGYHVIATTDGRFIGAVARGTRVETELAPGIWNLITWNPEKERLGAPPIAERVADLLDGRTYFARLTFGEWDIHGPRIVYSSDSKRGRYRACIDGDASLVALSPHSSEWSELTTWLNDLTPVSTDREAGQTWLDNQPSLAATHRGLAASRELTMTTRARALVTIVARDGVRMGP